jgi:hypothetical protein
VPQGGWKRLTVLVIPGLADGCVLVVLAGMGVDRVCAGQVWASGRGDRVSAVLIFSLAWIVVVVKG